MAWQIHIPFQTEFYVDKQLFANIKYFPVICYVNIGSRIQTHNPARTEWYRPSVAFPRWPATHGQIEFQQYFHYNTYSCTLLLLQIKKTQATDPNCCNNARSEYATLIGYFI